MFCLPLTRRVEHSPRLDREKKGKKKDERDREGKLRNPRRRQPRRWDRSAHRPPRWSPFYSFVSSSFGSSAPERHRLKQSNSPSEEIAIELKQERERVKGEYKNKFYKKMRRREVNLWWTVNFVDLHVGSLRNFLIMFRNPNRLTAVDRTFYYSSLVLVIIGERLRNVHETRWPSIVHAFQRRERKINELMLKDIAKNLLMVGNIRSYEDSSSYFVGGSQRWSSQVLRKRMKHADF